MPRIVETGAIVRDRQFLNLLEGPRIFNRDCRIVALVGTSSDTLALLCDVVVSIPASRTSRIQEAHITIGHLWCEMVDQLT